MAVATNEELQHDLGQLTDQFNALKIRVDGISMMTVFNIVNRDTYPSELDQLVIRGFKNFPLAPSYETNQNKFGVQVPAWNMLCAAVTAIDDETTMESLLNVSGFPVEKGFIEITFAQAFVIGTHLASKD
jgi:hypothetical protein